MSWKSLTCLIYFVIALCLPTDTTAQVKTSTSHFTKSVSINPFYPKIFPPIRGESPVTNGISNRAMLEIGGVALTGVGHLAFRAINASKVYIPLAVLSWGGYIYYRARTDRRFLSKVGFSSKNLGKGFRDATFAALGATALLAGLAERNQSLILHRDLIPLLLLYPAWGLVQQFLVQGLVSRNLTKAEGWFSSPYVVTPISAALFGSVHLPNWKLTAGTFALGLAFTPIYLKHGNLWPLGLYHGWLGALFYFWVLERNPWKETVGKNSGKNILPGIDVDHLGRPMLRLSLKF